MAAPLFSGLFSGLDASGVRRAGGSAPSEPVFPAKDFYFNDFAGVANGAILRNLPGWAAYNSAGSTAAQRDQWVIQGEAAVRTSTSGDFAAAPGAFIIARDAGSTDHVIRATIKALPNSGSIIYFAIGSTTQDNSLYFQCTNSGGVMQNYIIARNVGGTITTLLSQAPLSSGLGRALQVGDEIDLQVIDRRIHMLVNGRRITPLAGTNIDTGAAFTKGQLTGPGTRSSTGASYDDIYVSTISGTLTINATEIYWPGSMDLGGRAVPISGTYGGSVLALDYRVLDDATGAVISDWSRLDAAIGGGTWSANAFVPMSSIASNPKSRVQVRAANDVDIRALSGAFAVGFTVSSYGQSNSYFRGLGTATEHAVAHAYTWGADSGALWKGGAATTTERSQLWATQIAAATGIPCGVAVAGTPSSSIALLVDTTPDGNWDDYVTALTSANAWGYVQSFLWTQGESEANGINPYNAASYRGHFDTLLALLRGDASESDAAPVGVCVIGKKDEPHAGGQLLGDSNWSAARETQFGLTDKPGVFVATNLSDAVMSDPLHYVADAYVENGRRVGLSMRQALGYGGYNGRGPLITGATRSGAVITLPIDLNGSASVSGTWLTNYDASTDDFATLLTVLSVDVVAGSIVITLAADPGAPVKVRSFYGMLYTSPVRAIGTYADGTTIPVEPIFSAITSS